MNENICWFCKTNTAQDEFLLQKNMYNPKYRRVGQHAEYDTIEISIPRCKDCASVQKKATSIGGLYVVFLVIFAILATVVGYMIERKIEVANLSIYIGIGAFVIGLVMIVPFIKIIGPKLGKGGGPHWATFPDINALMKKGWLVGKPPSTTLK